MNTNFQIEQKSKGTDLYLNLLGEFDKTAAWDLIEIIYQEVDTRGSIFINTNKLQNISTYGKDTLNRNLHTSLKRKVLFGGDNAMSLIPDGCRLFSIKTTKHTCKGNCKNCLCKNINISKV